LARTLRNLAIAAALLAPAGGALAQDSNPGLGGLLMHLFGGGQRTPPVIDNVPVTHTPLIHRPKKKPRDFVPSSQTRGPQSSGDSTPAPSAPGMPTPAPTNAPAAPAFSVAVIGDSLAGQIASGLSDDLADRPEIAIQNKTKDSSGLVRDDFYDWSKAAVELADGPDKIDYVVVMIGINDSQPLRDGADVLDPLSDRWNEKYRARIDALLAPFKAKKIPFAWVSLPPPRSDRLSADMVKLNALDRAEAEKEGATIVDIFDAFANSAGGFDAYGPDIAGANAKLRGVDGVHFTKAGYDKAASFAAAEIRRAIDRDKPANPVAELPPDIEKAAKDINAQIKQDNADAPASPAIVERPLSGPIQSLTTRPLAPDGVLASKAAKPSPEAPKILRAGLPPTPVAGRADDFSAGVGQ